MGKTLRFGVATAATLALLLAACGGGSDSGTDAAASDSSGDGADAAAQEMGEAIESGNLGELDDCVGLAGAVATVALLPLAGSFGEATGVTDEEAKKAVEELEQYIPSELEGAFNTIRDAADNGAGYEDPAVESALNEIDQYLETECEQFLGG